MTDHFEHNPADHEDPAVGSTWFVGVAGSLILVVVLGGVTALFYRATDERVEAEVIEKKMPEVQAQVAAQQDLLRGGRHRIKEGDVETDKDLIPIEKAMQMVIDEYRGKSIRQSSAATIKP